MKKQNQGGAKSEQGGGLTAEQKPAVTAADCSLTLVLLKWAFDSQQSSLEGVIGLFASEGTTSLWAQWEAASQSLAAAHIAGDTHEVERLTGIRLTLMDRCLLDESLHWDVLALAKQVCRTLEIAQRQISDLVAEPAAVTVDGAAGD